MTGNIGPPAEDRPPTTALVLFTVLPRPQAPPRVLLDSLVETRILAVIS